MTYLTHGYLFWSLLLGPFCTFTVKNPALLLLVLLQLYLIKKNGITDFCRQTHYIFDVNFNYVPPTHPHIIVLAK